MTPVWIKGVGILGPGLAGWEQAKAILQTREPYVSAPVEIPTPSILPPRDRRRCSDTVRLALHVAQQTVHAAGFDRTATPSVFVNSAGDGSIVHRLLSTLATPSKSVSPTDFHNSVHNAPAFYWSLGTGCREASTSIAGGRHSFAAALLKSAAESVTKDTPVLMVCFDHPLPEPLNASYPLMAPLGIGLAITPHRTDDTLGRLELSWELCADVVSAARAPRLAALEDLWSENPVGRALPLLEVLASRSDERLAVPASHDAVLRIDVRCL